jgi:DNA ligase 1
VGGGASDAVEEVALQMPARKRRRIVDPGDDDDDDDSDGDNVNTVGKGDAGRPTEFAVEGAVAEKGKEEDNGESSPTRAADAGVKGEDVAADAAVEDGDQSGASEGRDAGDAADGSDGSDGSDGENSDADGDENSASGGDGKAGDAAAETARAGKKKSTPAAQPSVSLDFSEKPTWAAGKPVPYRFLADAFAKVEAIQGRLEIQAILTDVFRKVIATTPADLVPAIYLCVNKLAPAHEGVEIGVGESILLKALSQTSGSSVAALRAVYKEVGDLGDVAAGARSTQTTMFPPPPLNVCGVFAELRSIAEASGKAAVDAKKKRILKLLVASQTKNEARYLARALQGKLRIHLADKTVVTSLANAVTLAKLGQGTGVLLSADGKKKAKLTDREERVEEQLKDAASRLSAIYNQLPVWGLIVPELLKQAEVNDALAEVCKFTPGVPVSPMLAKPTKAIAEVLSRFAESKFTCEFKYDGERAQVHRLADGSVKIYSRNAEDLTPKYPDLVSALPQALRVEFRNASFVLDAEAVAYDVERRKILPFQELQSRKRKGVDEMDVKVKVCVFAFDLLFFDGKSMLLESLARRREAMVSSFDEVSGVFMFAKGHDSRDPEEIMELLNASIKDGCEGLMVKALDGPNGTYEPANRSQNWLKVKKDYLDGMGDTLDLVPIGGYTGRGKRLGTYGGFLLACYDPESEEYQSICKIGTGFSDKVLETLSAFFNDAAHERRLEGPKSYYSVSDSKNLAPDVWFEPCQVWEVKCADLSISPQHKAAHGLVDASKGIALRFPRFLRLRDDKSPDDATTAEQVAELYAAQSSVANKR